MPEHPAQPHVFFALKASIWATVRPNYVASYVHVSAFWIRCTAQDPSALGYGGSGVGSTYRSPAEQHT